MNPIVSQIDNATAPFSPTVMVLLLCLLFVVSNSALAQLDLSPKGRIDIQNDQKEDRMNSKKDLIFKNSGPLKDVVAGNAYISGDKVCEVEISTSYFQAAGQARVEALIDHSQCGPSNGKYTVSLKIQDAGGEIHTNKYQELWSRVDSAAITVNHTYQMSEDADLLKARIKLPSKDYCTCITAE